MKRTTYFSELAQMYFPDCTSSKYAVQSLNRSIKRCALLMAELETTSFAPYTHRVLSPKQFDMIIRHLGDPYDD